MVPTRLQRDLYPLMLLLPFAFDPQSASDGGTDLGTRRRFSRLRVWIALSQRHPRQQILMMGMCRSRSGMGCLQTTEQFNKCPV